MAEAPEETVAMTLLAIAIVVVLARLLGAAARLIRQPAVVGEILAGIALGPSLVGALQWGDKPLDERLFSAPVTDQLTGLANLGLVIFMFVVGLELDLGRVRSQRRRAVAVSLTSVAVPMAVGALLSILLYAEHGGQRSREAFILFIGVAMSVTAFPILARILAERGMHRTDLGSLALACAAVDDILAWSLLAVATALAGAQGKSPESVMFWSAVFIACMLMIVRPLAAHLVHRYERLGRLTPDVFATVLAGTLLSAWATEEIGIHFIFGAFLFGAVFPRDAASRFVHELLARLEDISVLLLLPVFFVITGMKVDVTALSTDDVLVLLLVVAAACGAKFVGSFAAARSQGIRTRGATALGVLLNTRGLTELVVVNVGFAVGILDQRLLTVFVVMAVVTTIMTAPLLRLVYPDDLVRRDIAAAERAALGVPDARRVLVALRDVALDITAVKVASDILSSEPSGQVIFSRVIPQRPPSGELGTGLAAELSAVADAVDSAAPLEALVRRDRVEPVSLSRIGNDAVAEWLAQAELLDVDAVVTTTIDADDGTDDGRMVDRLLGQCARRLIIVSGDGAADASAINVRDIEGPDAAAAFDVGVRLAAARGLPVVVGRADTRLPRRAVAWAHRGRSVGLRVASAADADEMWLSDPLAVRPARVHMPHARSGEVAALVVRAATSEPTDAIDGTFDRLAMHSLVGSGTSTPRET